jgi:hypothetical protein
VPDELGELGVSGPGRFGVSGPGVSGVFSPGLFSPGLFGVFGFGGQVPQPHRAAAAGRGE